MQSRSKPILCALVLAMSAGFLSPSFAEVNPDSQETGNTSPVLPVSPEGTPSSGNNATDSAVTPPSGATSPDAVPSAPPGQSPSPSDSPPAGKDPGKEKDRVMGKEPEGKPVKKGKDDSCPPGYSRKGKRERPGEAGKSKASAYGGKCRKRYLDTPPCLTWIDPELEPKAAILCVHGLGLHNGTYKDFGERLAKLGFAVYSVDVRGFGSWVNAQDRKKVDFDACLDDVFKTLRVIHRVHPNLPVFILGESMGGAIAIRATAEYPQMIDGLVSSVPSGDRFEQGKTTLRVALKLLTSPNKEFDVGSQVVSQATNKSELKEAWCGDPLARLNLSPKELVQFQNFMNENHESVRKITQTPVLMVQGQNDKLVKPQGTISLFNKIPCQDKKMEIIDNAEHLIFEEGQFDDRVIEMVNNWLSSHLQKKSDRLTKK